MARSTWGTLGGAVALVTLQLGLVTGCKCSGDDEKKEADVKSAEPAAPALPPGVEAKLLEALKEATADCKDVAAGKRINCNGGHKNALVRSFNAGERERIAALPTFTHLLQTGDEKEKALAASVLYAVARAGLGKRAGEQPESTEGLDAAGAKAMLDVTLALPPTLVPQAMPAATHAMMLTDQGDALFAALTDSVPVQARTMGYRYSMVHGRMAGFPKLQELAKSPSAAVALASIEGPRHMTNWTSEEQKTICPWVASYMEDPRAPVVSNSMAALGNCPGEHLDLLLDRIDDMIKGGKYSFIQAAALRDACGREAARAGKVATDEQCKRVRELQESAIKSTDLKGRVRAMTLSALAYDWPDEQTVALAKKLTQDDAVEVAQMATRLEARLARQTSGKPVGGKPAPATGSKLAPAPAGKPAGQPASPPAALKPAGPASPPPTGAQ